jgi:hypothetical protein
MPPSLASLCSPCPIVRYEAVGIIAATVSCEKENICQQGTEDHDNECHPCVGEVEQRNSRSIKYNAILFKLFHPLTRSIKEVNLLSCFSDDT